MYCESYMGVHVLLDLLNELRKRDKCKALPSSRVLAFNVKISQNIPGVVMGIIAL